MAVSRFKFQGGCYLYGKLRRSDFLPVGHEKDEEVLERGYSYVSSDDSDGAGLEYAFPEENDSDDNEYVPNEADNNALDDVDFA